MLDSFIVLKISPDRHDSLRPVVNIKLVAVCQTVVAIAETLVRPLAVPSCLCQCFRKNLFCLVIFIYLLDFHKVSSSKFLITDLIFVKVDFTNHTSTQIINNPSRNNIVIKNPKPDSIRASLQSGFSLCINYFIFNFLKLGRISGDFF